MSDVNDNNKDSLETGITEALVKHTQEFTKQIITVLPGIHCAIGYGLANSMLIEGDDGNIIIDTLESREAATKLQKEFQAISSKPIVAIIYTHNHADHVFGAEVLAGNNLSNVKVYSHSTTRKILDTTLGIVQRITYQRAARQFGMYLTEENGAINDGIGLHLKYDKNSTSALLYPTDTFDTDSWNLTIAGRDFVLYHAPGETDDQIVIYMPKEKVLFAADNIYKAFPNIYAIRGTTTRDAMQWVSSLDLMRNLRAEYLIPSHTKPISGAEYIYETITIYRDAMQFVHDQTVRFMNKGFSPDEIIGNTLIQLPKRLQEHPYLQEFYGTVDWSIRAIFDRYMGWYSGKSSDLNPDPPNVRAQNLIQLGGGSKKVLESAQTAYLEQKYQWCLELTEALNIYPEDLNKSEIIQLQVSTLQKLASLQTSANGRNWYLTKSLEIQGLIEIKPSPTQVAQTILKAPLKNIFMLLPVNLNYHKANDVNQLILFHFQDTNEKFSIHIRNGIADVKFQWPENIQSNAIDIIIEMAKEEIWREVIARIKNPLAVLSNDEIILKDGNGEINPELTVPFLTFLSMFTSE
ncbi:unnamed protein product [Rotaria sp. Silwood2]|nr:unnamed protein product [Rotaria sp. Silwood2]CAF2889113.1 unnamed protein product [Rotaria sp. Silwood2]CAF2990982.1 unnamed protein product [Rotaria sp. Silwood2]CAF3128691.1 unnamed protein product [Rotaria sp. Silwood2]CAF4160526.1 unnamed protein product [Rotaria sp. Silwood2]